MIPVEDFIHYDCVSYNNTQYSYVLEYYSRGLVRGR
jgi:hypothetical protein